MGGEERVIGEGMRVIFVVIKKKKKKLALMASSCS